jgi:uncharacterized membrane protein
MWQFLKDNYMLVSLAVGLLGVVIAVISLLVDLKKKKRGEM